jgi:hypothetical protein
VPRTHDRDQGPCTLTSRKQDPSRRGLHSQRSKFGGCSTVPTGHRLEILSNLRFGFLEIRDTSVFALHRRLRYHRLDLGVGADPRVHQSIQRY